MNFAFDVKLSAVVRITAKTEADARDAMQAILDAVTPSDPFFAGFNREARSTGLRVTEYSLSDERPVLFERDGVRIGN